MRRITPYALLLPLVLAATACAFPEEVAVEDPVETSATSEETTGSDPTEEADEGAGGAPGTSDQSGAPDDGDTLDFEEPAAFSHPVGAYEEEFQDGVEEDVVYTVDEVTTDGAGNADFTLTVEVPELGRVFGLGNMSVECFFDEADTPATSDDPVVEAEAGAHSMDMRCEAPQSARNLTVVMTNAEDEAAWTGPLE